MLRRGLATTYEARTGAEFGGLEEKYRAAETQAKVRKKGLWSGDASLFESPREYKTRIAKAEKNGGKVE
jgi:endonuclease YncB( thermonuclease family)